MSSAFCIVLGEGSTCGVMLSASRNAHSGEGVFRAGESNQQGGIFPCDSTRSSRLRLSPSRARPLLRSLRRPAPPTRARNKTLSRPHRRPIRQTRRLRARLRLRRARRLLRRLRAPRARAPASPARVRRRCPCRSQRQVECPAGTEHHAAGRSIRGQQAGRPAPDRSISNAADEKVSFTQPGGQRDRRACYIQNWYKNPSLFELPRTSDSIIFPR